MSHIVSDQHRIAHDSHERLQAFCESVLGLLKSVSRDSEIAGHVTAEFLKAIDDGRHRAAIQLKQQIDHCDSAATELRRLSASNQLPFRSDFDSLVQKIELHRGRATSVAQLLDQWMPPTKESKPDHVFQEPGQGFEPSPPLLAASPFVTPQIVEPAATIKRTGDVEDALPHDNEADNAQVPPASDRENQADRVAVPSVDSLVLKERRDRGQHHLQQGKDYLATGNVAQALAELNQAVELAANASSYRWRGDTFAASKQWKRALTDYDASLQLRPKDFGTCYNRAVVLRLSGQLNRSLKEFDRLIEQRTDHGPLYLNRGLIHLERNRLDLAQLEFEKTLKLVPDCREALERLNEIRQRRLRVPDNSAVSESHKHTTTSTSSSTAIALSCESSEAIPVMPSSRIETPRTTTLSSAVNSAVHCMIEFDCPMCHRSSSLRWDKIDRGRIIACPNCHRNFSTTSRGTFFEVCRNKQGKWVDVSRQKSNRAMRRSLTGWVAVAVMLLVAVGIPTIYRGSVAGSTSLTEKPLPTELEPRAEMFAQAWLRDDVSTLRRLTDPVQDRQLFPWRMRNPAPRANGHSTEGCPCAIERVHDTPTYCVLRVRFDESLKTSRSSAVELLLPWEKRDEYWYFQPARRQGGIHHSSNSR